MEETAEGKGLQARRSWAFRAHCSWLGNLICFVNEKMKTSLWGLFLLVHIIISAVLLGICLSWLVPTTFGNNRLGKPRSIYTACSVQPVKLCRILTQKEQKWPPKRILQHLWFPKALSTITWKAALPYVCPSLVPLKPTVGLTIPSTCEQYAHVCFFP